MSETNKLPEFTVKSVEKKPTRVYRKGASKYQPILDAFYKQTESKPFIPVEISIGGIEANYLRTQLKKLVDKNKLPLTISVVNGVVYIERKEEKTIKKLE